MKARAADQATNAERVLVLAPYGRDAALAQAMLAEGGLRGEICADMPALLAALAEAAAAVLMTQEAVTHADLRPLAELIHLQDPWSDLPFIVITGGQGERESNSAAAWLIDLLGNVSFIERPFHPYTLVSVAQTALRSRRRQYQAREQLRQLAAQKAALMESEDRFRTLAENIPVLAWMADRDGAVFWYNSRWYEYTGATPEDMAGWGWQRVHDPAVLPEVLARWKEAIHTGEKFSMVFPLRGRDGKFRPFLTKIEPLRDADGQVGRWFGTNVDITTEREAEEAVRASEERLRFALNAGYLGAWGYDEAAGGFECSALCKAHFGRSDAEEFSLDGLLAATQKQDRARLRQLVTGALAEGQDTTLEASIHWPDGSLHCVEMRGRAVRGPGDTVRMLGITMDITARKQIEAELRRHRDGLEQLVSERTGELAQALGRLRAEIAERERTEAALRQSQKMEAIGQLTGGIAHDFNNLLTGISGSIELLQTRLRQGRLTDLERYIVAARQSITRAAALTHRLLAFARRQTLERKTIDINTLCKGIEDLIRRTVGPSIAVEMVLAQNTWPTLCDANQLESALLNLCINAKDAMPEGGTLTIETANVLLDRAFAATQDDLVPGQYVALCVSDTGTGMSPETAANAFDPFFTTKPMGQGTGLGLSMVYGFVKQSEGHVRIHTQLGQGTTIRLYLPRHAGAAEAASPEDLKTETEPMAPAGKTVLIVEDEAVIRELIIDTLEEVGYRALSASDGLAGLNMIKRESIDLLLTDVGLPGMNGRQLADAARDLRPGLKILFMTGYAYNTALGNNMLDPGMHIVTKPFAMDALAAKVRALIEA